MDRADRLEHVDHALRRFGECAIGAELSLPAGQLPTQRGPVEGSQSDGGPEVVERSGVHGGVVADVEAVAVKAVRSHLREQWVHEGGTRVGSARGVQGVPHQDEVALELPR